MPMTNAEIIRVLQDIADLLEVKGENVFKVRAYQKAARSIEMLPVQIEQLVSEERLREVPGIGEAIEKKITELVTTGRLEYYEKLKAEFPEGISSLLEVPGVGPRKAAQLARELGIRSVDDLEAAIKEGKVAGLRGMGDKTAQNILRQIQALRRKKSEQRIPIGQALPVVDVVLDQLRPLPGVRNLVAAGSLRRFRETIGDIDLLGTADEPEPVIRAFARLPMVKEVLACGATKGSVVVAGGLKVDLRLVEHDAFGSLLQYSTGSKQHNINLRERARRIGLSLSEYGITDIATGRLEKFADEPAFYQRQGLAFIPPELREGGAEIERAERSAIPRLVERDDIRGDLHVHSDWSDGRGSIEDMALAAKAAGYQYLAITDHSQARGVARGLDPQRLREQMAEIKAVNERVDGIRVLSGVEVDIMADGTLDLPDDVLDGLDVVVAAVHSGLGQEMERMTARLLKAIENPAVDIIAHPTGRLILEREAAAVDMEALLKAAASHNKIVEINAMPERLDLRDNDAFRARELGVMIAINTDAHQPDHLEVMRFGVGVARRAWCEAKDIVNTRPVEQVLSYINHRAAA